MIVLIPSVGVVFMYNPHHVPDFFAIERVIFKKTPEHLAYPFHLAYHVTFAVFSQLIL